MLLLISPSKTQTMDVELTGPFTYPLFAKQVEQLVKMLRCYPEPELAKLMRMSAKLAQVNVQRYKDFQFPHTPDNSRQALCMYLGDQFQPMKVQQYTPEQLEHGQQHLAILSGLYGILRPLDLMQPYRLEMATKLAVAGRKNLYDFWGTSVTCEINNRLESDPHPLLVNLASAEYFKVICKKELKFPVLTLSFKQNKGCKLKTIAIYAKRARGAMVNFMITHKISLPEELKKFTTGGYSFSAEQSTANEWVFVCSLD